MEYNEKFVDFEKYCARCIYRARCESEDPCDECLSYPVNENSTKPVYFEEGKKRHEKK